MSPSIMKGRHRAKESAYPIPCEAKDEITGRAVCSKIEWNMAKHILRSIRSTLVPHAVLWIILAGFLVVVLFVNPVRETEWGDDFAYALTVKNLLDTGQYRAHDWISANMPFQAYWGGLFAHFLGYSHTSLRISTLVLAFVGLIAFYGLAKEHGLENLTAGLVTLVMLSSPLFVLFSFNFMTDVPFLACLILALLFYTRALRLRGYRWMVLASLAGSAAILTRAFGMALVAGVFLSWLLDTRSRRDVLLIVAGLALPITASIWQVYMGTQDPSWGVKYNSLAQWHYLENLADPAMNLLWRPGVILQYQALFTIPLVLLALVALPHELRGRRTLFAASTRVSEKKSKNWELLFLVGIAIYVLLGMLWVQRIMPILGWNFARLYLLGFAERCFLTLVTATGAVLYGRIFLMRYFDKECWAVVSASERILDLVALFLLLFYLIFFHVYDIYLTSLLPFTLIVLGKHLQEWLLLYRRVPFIACLFLLAISAMPTRASLEEAEALWQGGELLRNKGVEVSEIAVLDDCVWNSYYGDFDNYLANINHRPMDNVKDFYERWNRERLNRATYVVSPGWDSSYPGELSVMTTPIKGVSGEKWEIIAKIPYRSILFREKDVIVVKRVAP